MNETEVDTKSTTSTEGGQPVPADPGSALRARPPGKEFRYEASAGNGLSPLQVGAGMVILGLGIAQLLAPRRVARSTGVHARPALVRTSGVLAIASAAGILGRARQGARQGMGERTTASGALAVEKCITINKSPEECYRFWRNFDRFPEFMQHLDAVEKITDTRSHWKAKAPIGSSVEWDAEITADQPGEVLAWHSLDGADVDNGGTVRFERAPGGRGTIVRVEMQYKPPGGKAGALVAKLFGENPSQQMDGDLRRFKQLIETGEITTTEGQPAGERSAMVKLIKKGVPG